MTSALSDLSPLRRLAWRVIPTPVRSIGKLLLQRRSFLYEQHYLRSMLTHRPVGQDNDPVPWFSYSAIELLRDRLRPGHRVFEYGSGNSTIFFATKTDSVTAVEHNEHWYGLVAPQVDASGGKVLFEADVAEGYPQSIARAGGMFDLVVVDGVNRVRCVEAAIDHLSDRGVLILDDASRDDYQAAIDLMLERGYRRLSLAGLRPSSPYFDRTDIFYRDGNMLGL